MDALELFLREHASVHSAQVAEGEQRSLEDGVLRHLTEEHLRARIDVSAVRAYRVVVGRNTREAVQALPTAEWLLRFWEGKTKSWFLSWMGVGHNYLHLGAGPLGQETAAGEGAA